MARIFVASSSQYINCTDIAAVDGLVNLTLSFWALKPANNNDMILGKTRVTDAANGFHAYLYGSHAGGYTQFRARVSTGGGFGYVTVPCGFVWSHYAMVYNGAGATDALKLKCYFNATEYVMAYSGVLATSVPANTDPFCIGRTGSYTGTYSGGSFANVRLYAATLSVNQIRADMCGLLPIAPLGNWPLGMASPEPDLSGNGYAGTLVNAPAIANHPPVCIPGMYDSEYYEMISQLNAPRAYYRNLLMRAA